MTQNKIISVLKKYILVFQKLKQFNNYFFDERTNGQFMCTNDKEEVNELFTPLNKFYVTSTIIRIDIKAS